MASPSTTAPSLDQLVRLSRRRTQSTFKRNMPITPVLLVIISSIVMGGIAVAFAILGLTIMLLVMNLTYLAAIAWLFINLHRTGNYWNVPFPAHPESPAQARRRTRTR